MNKVKSKYRFVRKHLALVIPAHNEELGIELTIASAIQAGQKPENIYLVDDNSSDRTLKIAKRLLGRKNVISVKRSGKALAIKQAVDHFDLTKKYLWIHVSDADGIYEKNYFLTFRKALRGKKYAAATGYIYSQRGNWISRYRSYEYATGLEVTRRAQDMMGVIPVVPGPTSCFRSDIFNQLDFTVDSLTEDFDVTLQIHRHRLGKIAYLPAARTHTQDPRNLIDYIKQIERWYRGNFQSIVRHRIGIRPQRIDAYLSFILLEQFLFIGALVAVPFMAWFSQSYANLAVVFLFDLVIFMTSTAITSYINRRPDIFAAFPLFYFLRLVNLWVFLKAFIDVVLLKRYRSSSIGWSTADRRYAMNPTNAKVAGKLITKGA